MVGLATSIGYIPRSSVSGIDHHRPEPASSSMSVIRPKPPEDPIQYDPSAVFATGGIIRDGLASLSPPARSGPPGDADRHRSLSDG